MIVDLEVEDPEVPDMTTEVVMIMTDLEIIINHIMMAEIDQTHLEEAEILNILEMILTKMNSAVMSNSSMSCMSRLPELYDRALSLSFFWYCLVSLLSFISRFGLFTNILSYVRRRSQVTSPPV